HRKVYAPLTAEASAVGGNKEYDPLLAERSIDKLKGRSVWLFGVVTNRGAGPGGAAYVALSLRSLQQRNLCESDDEDTCRVTVGEFHYVHHQPDGTPYADRTAMSDAVIRAAKDAGLRIALLRVIYARGGAERPAEGPQLRFCDGSLDRGLADVETLAARYAKDD